MFISVDFPAPFSPRSACTSPRRTSKSTSSLATMPGNSFLIPRISRTSSFAATPLTRADPNPETRGAGTRARPSLPDPAAPLQRGRHLQLAGDDLRLVAVHQRDVRLRHGRVDLADRQSPVLQVEVQVGAALELAGELRLDDADHAVVDLLDTAREDALAEAVLVLVDADRPGACFVRRL